MILITRLPPSIFLLQGLHCPLDTGSRPAKKPLFGPLVSSYQFLKRRTTPDITAALQLKDRTY